MAKGKIEYFDVLEAKRHYLKGGNVTEILRRQKNIDTNTPEIIELSYDLQAGKYIEISRRYPEERALYIGDIAPLLDKHIIPNGSLLDVGTGEFTTLSPLVAALTNKPKNIYAFDISWSRLFKGLAYAKEKIASNYKRLIPFVGDMSEIPLLDKSINITTSSHALEPNGGKLEELMSELFRVTIDKLVLFEPCFEINTEEGKKRMEQLGYIKNIDGVVEKLGGKMIEKTVIKNPINPLNPTVCFVIAPPVSSKKNPEKKNFNKELFSVPGTNYLLEKIDDFYFSNDTGFCYPILKNIPVLKSNTSILASSLCEELLCIE